MDLTDRPPPAPPARLPKRLGRVLALTAAVLITDLTLTMDTVVWGAPTIAAQSEPSASSWQPVSRLPIPSDPAERIEWTEHGRSPERPPQISPVWTWLEEVPRPAPSDAPRYSVQPGDSLQSVALRFGVSTASLRSWNGLEIADQALLAPGRELRILTRQRLDGSQAWLLPDSELVYSPSAKDLDTVALAAEHGGYLNHYREKVNGEWLHGPEVVLRAALDHSINPRLLLAVLELQAGWLTNPERPRQAALSYPIWPDDRRLQGLYLQLSWAASELSHAYYGWRQGTLLELPLADGTALGLAPDLNAATVAVMHLSARMSDRAHPHPAGMAERLMQVYGRLFGDPWSFDLPLFDADVRQPPLLLPFPAENPWVFTGGPHGAWGGESAWAALDFAPKWDRQRRSSNKDVVAVADAVVARVERGVVVLDLDGDGYEQSGWAILYLHIMPAADISVGMHLAEGDLVGVAAEEGGVSHGLHLHLARKYNGEWVAADGPLPLDLAGWRVRAGAQAYLGVLYRQDSELLACPYASQELLSVRGGSRPSDVGLRANLRGCWSVPDSPRTATLAANPSLHRSAHDAVAAWVAVLDPGPLNLPPTLLLAAPD